MGVRTPWPLGRLPVGLLVRKGPSLSPLDHTMPACMGPESAQGDIKHIMLTDIMVRNPKDLPDHDLYVAGFPCQPFSAMMGLQEGVSDRHGRRGRVIAHVEAALQAKQPRAFTWRTCHALSRRTRRPSAASCRNCAPLAAMPMTFHGVW
jgi:hypothetical protein